MTIRLRCCRRLPLTRISIPLHSRLKGLEVGTNQQNEPPEGKACKFKPIPYQHESI